MAKRTYHVNVDVVVDSDENTNIDGVSLDAVEHQAVADRVRRSIGEITFDGSSTSAPYVTDVKVMAEFIEP